jgi:hypothetical protein
MTERAEDHMAFKHFAHCTEEAMEKAEEMIAKMQATIAKLERTIEKQDVVIAKSVELVEQVCGSRYPVFTRISC